MSEDRVANAAAQAKDGARKFAGKVLGDAKLQAEGQTGLTVDKLQAAYDKRLEQVIKAGADIEAYTKAKPWLALGAALGTGLLVGNGLGRGKRRVVYVRKVKAGELD